MTFQKIIISLLFLIGFVNSIHTQVVYTDPAFPTQSDDIILYFDASQGNGALAGFNGDVYAHTGVISSNSTSATDWQHVQGNWGTADANVLMTAQGNDIYTLSYNINDYYGIAPGEIVEKLSFVFRNVDGSTVGRAEDGSDIFYDIYPEDQGLAANIINPADNNNVFVVPAFINIELETNEEADIRILDNGQVIFEETTSSVDFMHNTNDIGNHELEFQFTNQDTSFIMYRKYVVLNDAYPTIDIPADAVNGINYINNGDLGFKLTAPNKWNVFFLCPANEYSPDIDYLMQSNGQGDYYIELDASLFANGRNNYQYLIDGDIKVADPFSTVVLDPWNDWEVETEILALYGPYPDGQTSGIVTTFDVSQEMFQWTDQNFNKPDKSNLVIYELLLRDFLEDHSYRSLIDTLDYLDRLGITAIELMPINEFEGNNSWGYNPSFHMAVDKYYGSKDQLKSFINECHSRGIAVINDVVFNHAFSQSPLCQMYWNPADFRPAPNSPYLNEIPRHPFNVGYDFNHESAYTKDWVKQVLTYWIEEFHFDGFRFDLSKGLTQTNSGNNAGLMSQYDQSRIDILKDYADHIWSVDGDSYMICEHFAENSEETVLSNHGMMLWGNITHDYAEAGMGYSSGIVATSYKARGWDEPNLISYAESHDEERLGYKIKTWGNSNSSYNTKDLWTFPERVVAANLIYLTIPGAKMLWQFGELGYDFSINTCENGTVNDNCRLSRKPIRWDYKDQESRAIIYDKLSALLQLRKNLDVFSTDEFYIGGDSYIKRIILNTLDLKAVALANFDVSERAIVPNFPETGTWYDFFTGDPLEVSNLGAEHTMNAGEYRLYFNELIDPEDGFFSSTANHQFTKTTLSPNPLRTGASLNWCQEIETKIHQIKAISNDGKSQHLNWNKTAECILINTESLNAGFYTIDISTDDGEYHSSVIIID